MRICSLFDGFSPRCMSVSYPPLEELLSLRSYRCGVLNLSKVFALFVPQYFTFSTSNVVTCPRCRLVVLRIPLFPRSGRVFLCVAPLYASVPSHDAATSLFWMVWSPFFQAALSGVRGPNFFFASIVTLLIAGVLAWHPSRWLK